jgi:hypothetical protein
MLTSARSAFLHCSRTTSLTSRTAVYGPVRTVVWQGSAGDCRPYADQVGMGPAMPLGRKTGNHDLGLTEFKGKETTRRSSGRVWRKVPDDILSYLGVGLHLSARRLPPPLLRPCFVALSSDFVEGTFIPFPESTA